MSRCSLASYLGIYWHLCQTAGICLFEMNGLEVAVLAIKGFLVAQMVMNMPAMHKT